MSPLSSPQPTTGKRRGTAPLDLLVHFSYLQLLDLLTTLLFLSQGVSEANPVVRYAMALAPSPLEALLVLKLAALAAGVYAWGSGRRRLLSRANLLFGGLVVWNVLALLIAVAR